MCSRFTLGSGEGILTEEEREVYLRRARQLGLSVRLCGDIAPTDIAPVLAPGSLSGTPSLFPMQWGFRHPERALSVINARAETADTKDMFQESTFSRRCLIPAAGYYEWKKEEGRKKKVYFYADGRLWLGGLYFRSSKQPVPVFVILTQDAPEELKSIHARMPLLFKAEEAPRWLNRENSYQQLLTEASRSVKAKM